jgi:dihydrofolate reductase
MILSIIVARSKNNVIGRNNDLPWHLSDDLKNFKRITTGHPIIMGRKTYDSIGKPLKDRTNIIITRQHDYLAEGCKVVHSLEEAVSLAKLLEASESFIIGGAELINQSLSLVTKLYLTEIDANVEGDTYLNPIDLTKYEKVDEKTFSKSEKNDYSFTIIEYLKK